MKLLGKMSYGLARISTDKYGAQLWTRRKLRKNNRGCVCCKQPIAQGLPAWGPLTNGYNRMDRLCHPCFTQLPLEKS
jgi:hypothetical protein